LATSIIYKGAVCNLSLYAKVFDFRNSALELTESSRYSNQMKRVSLFDAGPPPPCPVPFNMAAYILAKANVDPDKPALELLKPNGAEIWSYHRLEHAIRASAGGLQSLGLPQGARILLRIGNDVDFPIMFLAAILSGFVPVPTSSQLTAPEVDFLLRDLNPDLVVFGDGIAQPLTLPCPSLGPADITDFKAHSTGKVAMGDPNRPAYIVYTSGTSGRPRGVVHAHRAICARRMMWDGWYGLRTDDRLLHAGAFNWTYTLGTGLMDPWSIGATALIPAPDTGRAALVEMLRRYRASIFAAAPGVYRQILKTGTDLTLPHLRHSLSAGEKLPQAQKETWERSTNRPVFEALGMSEVSTFISTSPELGSTTKAAGYPQKGRRIAVLDPETYDIVERGREGVLAISSRDPGMMLGYFNDKVETRAKYHGEWFLTGDIVEMADDDAVTYLGRSDDMMNAGGYRVSPIEVETALNAHPDIIESAAAMIEVKPDTFVIAAFYHSDIDLAETVLADWCADRLAHYKCPRVFIAQKTLPKGANNKLRRGDLRAADKGVT
jgi:acyl-coenzyme A synthetase/AMP-(fatty) acid ligase